jgi:hypothetical protein
MKQYMKEGYLAMKQSGSNKSTKFTFDVPTTLVARNTEQENVFVSRNVELGKF